MLFGRSFKMNMGLRQRHRRCHNTLSLPRKCCSATSIYAVRHKQDGKMHSLRHNIYAEIKLIARLNVLFSAPSAKQRIRLLKSKMKNMFSHDFANAFSVYEILQRVSWERERAGEGEMAKLMSGIVRTINYAHTSNGNGLRLAPFNCSPCV